MVSNERYRRTDTHTQTYKDIQTERDRYKKRQRCGKTDKERERETQTTRKTEPPKQNKFQSILPSTYPYIHPPIHITTNPFVIIIVISKFLKRYSKAKRTRAPAYSRAFIYVSIHLSICLYIHPTSIH